MVINTEFPYLSNAMSRNSKDDPGTNGGGQPAGRQRAAGRCDADEGCLKLAWERNG